MIQIRKSSDRGHFDHGWLKTSHTFSFADYHDPAWMGFRSLRVINEDVVEPGQGFDTHAHRDMEILTVIVSGELEHKDNMGNTSVIRPGEVQRMTAGTGVTHSEFNASKSEPVHLLQIWIFPDKKGYTPGYEQKAFDVKGRANQLNLIVSNDGRENSIRVHQNVLVYQTALSKGRSVKHAPAHGCGVWIQIIKGICEVNGQTLRPGDGAATKDEKNLLLAAADHSEFLLFDLA